MEDPHHINAPDTGFRSQICLDIMLRESVGQKFMLDTGHAMNAVIALARSRQSRRGVP